MPTSFFDKSHFSLKAVERIIRRDPLFFALLAAACAILATDSSFSLWFAIVAGFIFVGTCFHPATRRLALIVLPFLVVFSLLHKSTIRKIESFPLADAIQQAGDSGIEITGRGWVVSRKASGKTSPRSVFFQLESVLVMGHEVSCNHTVPVWIQGRRNLPIHYGESFRFTGRLHQLEGATSPGGFDSSQFFYRSQGSLAQLVIRPGDQLSASGVARKGKWIIHRAIEARSRMEEALLYQLDPGDQSYARIILAMALGLRENSPADIEELFRLSGTMHIFAVSGLHVGIVAGLLFYLFHFAGLPKRYTILLVVPLILFYAVITGLRPSAVRAALMLSIVLIGFILKNKPRILNGLGLAGLIILAFDTQQIFQPGFQLSFAVLVAIALFAGKLRVWFFAPFEIDPFLPRKLASTRRIAIDSGMRKITTGLAVSVAAWIGSATLLAWHFQGVSLVGVFANLVMVPIAGIMVSLAGVSVISFGTKLSWITALANKLNIGLAIILTAAAQFFANLPMAHVYTNPRTFLSSDRLANTPSLQIDTTGIRGESASLVSVPDNGHWMIDSGSESTFRWQMLPILRSRGINQLDGLIISHGDQGHIGAIPIVISRFNPKIIIESPFENRARIYQEILSLMKQKSIRREALSQGQRLRIDALTEYRILFPYKNVKTGSLADDRSLVFKLHHRNWSVLFTFDSGFATEKILLEKEIDVSADLWIRGQHSGAPSGLDEFVQRVNPHAIISSNASYPVFEKLSDEWEKMISDRGIHLFDLEKCGTVTTSFTEDEMRIVPFRSEELPIVWKTKSAANR